MHNLASLSSSWLQWSVYPTAFAASNFLSADMWLHRQNEHGCTLVILAMGPMLRGKMDLLFPAWCRWVDPDDNVDNGVLSDDGRDQVSVLRLDALMLMVQVGGCGVGGSECMGRLPEVLCNRSTGH